MLLSSLLSPRLLLAEPAKHKISIASDKHIYGVITSKLFNVPILSILVFLLLCNLISFSNNIHNYSFFLHITFLYFLYELFHFINLFLCYLLCFSKSSLNFLLLFISLFSGSSHTMYILYLCF